MRGGTRAFVIVLLLLLGSAPLWTQESASGDDTAGQLRSILDELKKTRAEVESYRAEVQSLRTQVEELRHQAQPAKAGAGGTAGQSSSLEQRVSAVEDQQQLNTAKIDEQYQTKVESGSRYRVKLTGMLLLNLSGNGGHVDDIDLPELATAGTAGSGPGNITGGLRQSQVGLQVNGPEIWGARSSADLFFDFFGGFTPTIDGQTMGIARMTIARGRLDWSNTALVFGQDTPILSPLAPTSLASVAVPAMGYSGNLWTWTPQVRAEHRWSLSKDWKYSLEGGVMDPLSGQYIETEYNRQPDAGERSRAPALAVHNSFRREVLGRTLSIGFGGYYARQYYGFGRNVDAWAASADWNLPITKWLEWSGEAYRGRALGGLWGAVGRSVVVSGPGSDPATRIAGLDDAGGWTQLKFRATPRLEFNAAIGQTNPYGSDFRLFGPPMPYAFITRNQTTMINFIERLRSNLLFSLEYRHLNTAWSAAPSETADHVNASIGVTF